MKLAWRKIKTGTEHDCYAETEQGGRYTIRLVGSRHARLLRFNGKELGTFSSIVAARFTAQQHHDEAIAAIPPLRRRSPMASMLQRFIK